MEWQQIIVSIIGLAVAAWLLRRAWCFVRGGGRKGCASCGSTNCPLHRYKKER